MLGLSDRTVDKMRDALMGRTALRDLPWRRTRDPWAVLVAESMLQQTQVTRVIPKWHAFLERFPDATACAAATVGEVVQSWSGLGYNRRAVKLHRCAQIVRDRHGGALPEDLRSLLELPGVGPYTARAVLTFAFERDVAVVDTNVARVLARLRGERLGLAAVQALADVLVPRGEGWRWNQAMIDTGALRCRKRAPLCERCELAEICRWRGAGPDPSTGSAGTTGRQSRFAGSDRQGRGRFVAALRVGPVRCDDLALVMGWNGDDERAQRVAAAVVADGLAVRRGQRYVLP